MTIALAAIALIPIQLRVDLLERALLQLDLVPRDDAELVREGIERTHIMDPSYSTV